VRARLYPYLLTKYRYRIDYRDILPISYRYRIEIEILISSHHYNLRDVWLCSFKLELLNAMPSTWLDYCAFQNLTTAKVIIIHRYVHRLYCYVEAYNVTSAIAC